MRWWHFLCGKKETMEKFLVVGLGNVGVDYKDTRHNIGFTVVDALAKTYDAAYETKRYGDVAAFNHKGKKILLLKPSTLMNLSGKAVVHWVRSEKIKPENLLIVTDDLHLDFGNLRMRKRGSHGGHNGLKDIQMRFGEFSRLRVGIGNQFKKGRQSDFVLSPWKKEEVQKLPEIVSKAEQAAMAFVLEGVERAMNTHNGEIL
jgi:PTH1 family peptidyl-tRNA hydrolase